MGCYWSPRIGARWNGKINTGAVRRCGETKKKKNESARRGENRLFIGNLAKRERIPLSAFMRLTSGEIRHSEVIYRIRSVYIYKCLPVTAARLRQTTR